MNRVLIAAAILACAAAPAAQTAAPAVTEAQARAWAAAAEKQARGDVTVFSKVFEASVRTVLPTYSSKSVTDPVILSRGDGFAIFAIGQIQAFHGVAVQNVRKMEPVASSPWPAGVMVSIVIDNINAPNFEKVVLKKNGETVTPTADEFKPEVMTTALGAQRTVRDGYLCFDPAIFEQGADITITAIPEVGSNLVHKLTDKEIAKLR